MKPQFLNVDLEIVSRKKLDVLVRELGERVFVLYSGPAPRVKRGKRVQHLLTMEIAGGSVMRSRTPDRIIHALCDVIEKLPPVSRRLWDGAERVFDIGYELRPEGKELFQLTLKPDTVERVAALGATIAVTSYPHDLPVHSPVKSALPRGLCT
jgi:hypothetical protein